MGVVFALLAFIFWGLGDFLIQKTARRLGTVEAIFFVTVFTALILTPFVLFDLDNLRLTPRQFNFLILSAMVVILSSLVNFQALKIGKLSVIVPIYALEVPVAAILARLITREYISLAQGLIIILIILGLVLVSIKTWRSLKKFYLEPGVGYAVVGAVGLGIVNFLVATGSRLTSPLVFNWVVDTITALVIFIYLLIFGYWKKIIRQWRTKKILITGASASNTLAWLAYSFSILSIPIAVAVGIGESYIALSALLGITFNHEKLKRHQWWGLGLTLASTILLAIIT